MDPFNYQAFWNFVKDKADEAAKILFVIAGSYILIRAVRTLADRLVRLIEKDDPSAATERQLRARTLAAIFKSFARITIVIIAGLTIMATLDIAITPLVGAAGIAGLAISFGAQNFIRDVISGFFILFENQFKVGDVIRAGGVSGVVEDMNLRITILRDMEGVAHFIPNGEIKVVSNLTKDYSQAVVNLGVSYHQNLDRVIQVLNEVGEELSRDALFSPYIMEAPKVLGIESFEDSRIALRMVTKTRPLKQWDTARELRRRIKLAFDREGIEIALPQRIIYSHHEEPAKSQAPFHNQPEQEPLKKN